MSLDALLFNRVVKSATARTLRRQNPQVMELHLELPAQAHRPGGHRRYGHGHLAATLGWVEYRIMSMLNQMFPVGTIMLWSGTIEFDDNLEPRRLGALQWALRLAESDAIASFLCAGGLAPSPASWLAYRARSWPTHPRRARRPSTQARRQRPTSPTTSRARRSIAAQRFNAGDLPYYTVCYIYEVRRLHGG